jgi:two-component system phosphate regulon sensor histidine kinase PhoR
MLSFRKKVVASYAGLYLIFLAIVFVVVRFSVGTVVRRAMSEQSAQLIGLIQNAGNADQAIQILKGRERTYFYRVGLLDTQGHILYDSKARKLFGASFNPYYETNHPEVIEAIARGQGYHEDYSVLFAEKFAYLAQSFDLAGRQYVLRLAFPFGPIEGMTRDFEIGFSVIISLVLASFALLNWLVISRLTAPVQRIISSIEPYQRGETDSIPVIPLAEEAPSTEFDRLSDTLNRLNRRIQSQIAAVRAERNERNALLEALSEGVIAYQLNGSVAYLNSAAKRLIGLVHAPVLPCMPADIRCLKRAILDQTAELCQQVASTHQSASFTHERSAGGRQVIQMTASQVRDAGGILVVLQDITSSVQVLRMGKDFVANASHELRTPITIIRGFAETLHEHPELAGPEREGMTSKILRNCSRMEVLIQNLLLLADLEHIPEEHQYVFDIQETVLNCIENCRDLYPEITVNLVSDGGDFYPVMGSSDLLELTITNLLNNAVKYSSGAAWIEIRLSRKSDEIVLEIEDHGIGISENDLPHIFDRFYTVDKARSRKLGGAGLGLAIVKSIVENHAGSITAASQLGQGTTFRITLPQAQLSES